jgi:hypothetical protein
MTGAEAADGRAMAGAAHATGQKPIPSIVCGGAACALGVVVALVKCSLAAR